MVQRPLLRVPLAIILTCCGLTSCRERERAASPAPLARPLGPAITPSAAPSGPVYAHDYHFTEDWFSQNIPVWQQVLGPLEGKPKLRYLEIGAYEGRSAFWVLDNVLTHPTSQMTTIDVFLGDYKDRYFANVKASGHASQITTLVGSSQTEVRKLPLESFDIIYIDGSHAAADVLADAVQCWEVLKPEGILIFDDYLWTGYGSPLPPELLPRAAIDAFLMSYRHSLEIVHYGYQVIVRKRPNPCATASVPDMGHYFCSPFGPYVYDWRARRLRHPEDGTAVELSPDESAVLEAYLSARSFDYRENAPAFAERPEFRALAKRLKVKGLDD
jgi:SAM-dependent methyltransferase